MKTSQKSSSVDSDTMLDYMREIFQKDHDDFILKEVQGRARGCLFGAFIGDSMGSRLEFQANITEKDIQDALQMNGGGIFKLIPAQLTDDTELAIAQAFGILSSFKNDINDVIANILQFYYDWITSNPFDFGITIQSSWSPLLFSKWESIFELKDFKEVVREIQQNAKIKSSESQSNGFLMKQSALGIFLWRYPQDVIFEFAKQDTLLTHSHPFCIDVSKIYLFALSQLVKRGNNVRINGTSFTYYFCQEHFKIYCECRNIINSDQTFGQEIKDVFKEVEKLFQGIEMNNYQQGKKPLNYQWKNDLKPPAKKIGWVKWAFIYSMIALLSDEIKVSDFFYFVLSQKGDTDTNLCIAGAIVGARYGMSVFDKKYIEKVENCKPETNNNQKRPKIYAPGCYKQLSDLLILKSFERDFQVKQEIQ